MDMNVEFSKLLRRGALVTGCAALLAGFVVPSLAVPIANAYQLPTDPPCVNVGDGSVCDDDSVDDAPPAVGTQTPYGEGALGDIAAPGHNAGGHGGR